MNVDLQTQGGRKARSPLSSVSGEIFSYFLYDGGNLMCCNFGNEEKQCEEKVTLFFTHTMPKHGKTCDEMYVTNVYIERGENNSRKMTVDIPW